MFRNLLQSIKVCTVLLILTSLELSASSSRPEGVSLKEPLETEYGIVATNQYQSAVYLIQNGQVKTLLSAPGCGRYMTVDPSGAKIGIKFIDEETGRQAPAIIDLKTGEVKKLHSLVGQAGQVSFSSNGKVAYSIGDSLCVEGPNGLSLYDLGIFSNRTPLSPDGNFVIYNDSDRLWKYSLSDGKKELVTDPEGAFGNVSWSPDGSKLVYESINARVYLRNLSERDAVLIGEGQRPSFSPDGNSLIFFRKTLDQANQKLLSSDIYRVNVSTKSVSKVGVSGVLNEDVCFSRKGNSILYRDMSLGELKSCPINASGAIETEKASTVFKLSEPLPIKLLKKSSIERLQTEKDLPDYGFVHQVLDTRDSGLWTDDPYDGGNHEGYVCCGATSAIEAVISYKILPPWPLYTHGHWSQYGRYLSDAYTINGRIMDNFASRWHSGAHGYMWSGGGSPYSNMAKFLSFHGISSSVSDEPSYGFILNEVTNSRPYIVCSTGLTGGHVVMIVGHYGSAHTFYVNDPYGDKNPTDYDHSKYDGKNAIYDWSDNNTGHQMVTPVVWGATVNYQPRVQLYYSYPQVQGTGVPRLANIRLQFSEPVQGATLLDQVQLQDSNGVSLSLNADTSQCSLGIVTFKPSKILDKNMLYRVTVKSGIKNYSGSLSTYSNINYSFTTASDDSIGGRLIDGLEDANSWTSPSLSSASAGLDASQTKIQNAADYKVQGSAALGLNYKFSGTSSGLCVIERKSPLFLGDNPDSSFGLWVYGDNSHNALEFWFKDSKGTQVLKSVDSLNWVGWKFVKLQLDDLAAISQSTGKNLFAVAVRQNAWGGQSGKVLFDLGEEFLTPSLVTGNYPADGQVKVAFHDSVTVDFNRPMDTVKSNAAFSITPAIKGTISWLNSGRRLVFKPDSAWTAAMVFHVCVNKNACDINGQTLGKDVSFSFQALRVKLTLLKSYPKNGAQDVSRTVEIRACFDGPIDVSTLANNFAFMDANGKRVPLKADQAAYAKGAVVFSPQNPLTPGALYSCKLLKNLGDLDKLKFGSDLIIQFRVENNVELTGGKLVDDFEGAGLWTRKADQGADSAHSSVVSSSEKIHGGAKSAKLVYKFNCEGGSLRFLPPQPVSIPEGTAEIGLWIYGNLSNNSISFSFNTDGGVVDVPVDSINWTGWKLKTLDLSKVSLGKSGSFAGLNLKMSSTGDASGFLYMDDLSTGTMTGILDNKQMPTEFSLSQNYPNPFNPSTQINFSLPEKSNVSLRVFDALGRQVYSQKGEFPAGHQSIMFNGKMLSSGVYVYELVAKGQSGHEMKSARKMVMLK